MTLLRVASNQCTAGRPIPRRTYALPVMIRVIPENEIPRALHVDIYLTIFLGYVIIVISNRGNPPKAVGTSFKGGAFHENRSY